MSRVLRAFLTLLFAGGAASAQVSETTSRVSPRGAGPVLPFAAPFRPIASAAESPELPGVPGDVHRPAPPEKDAPTPDEIAENIRKSFSPNFAEQMAQRPHVSFGDATLPAVGMPNVGDDFAGLWTKAHEQSDSLLIAAYNFDDMDMARSIVAAAKAGKKIVFVGDYSNWFPDRMPVEKDAKPAPRTEAMTYVLDNLNPNLDLHILKGLGGASGINHNKFSVFSRSDRALAQTGSFNYTKTSQNNHFENFVFTDDADRIKFLKDYHGWLVRRARPYSEDLQPEDPTFSDDDPIPADPSRLASVPLPKTVGTPKSEAGEWFVKYYGLAKKDILVAMFAMFPTPDEVAAIEARLAEGVEVNMIVDRGQVSRAGALWGLIQKGAKLKISAGPEEVVYKTAADPEHSKLHMKYVGIDGGLAAKGGDSLNDSFNAEQHNFENLGFWEGHVSLFLYTYVKEVLWPLAYEPSAELLQKLEDAYNNSQKTADGKEGVIEPPKES